MDVVLVVTASICYADGKLDNLRCCISASSRHPRVHKIDNALDVYYRGT